MNFDISNLPADIFYLSLIGLAIGIYHFIRKKAYWSFAIMLSVLFFVQLFWMCYVVWFKTNHIIEQISDSSYDLAILMVPVMLLIHLTKECKNAS